MAPERASYLPEAAQLVRASAGIQTIVLGGSVYTLLIPKEHANLSEAVSPGKLFLTLNSNSTGLSDPVSPLLSTRGPLTLGNSLQGHLDSSLT